MYALKNKKISKAMSFLLAFCMITAFAFSIPGVAFADAEEFVAAEDTANAGVWDGTLDFSWYDENNVKTEYHISTPAQWEAVAWICSEQLADLADYSAKTGGNIKGITGTVPTKQNNFEGVQFYLDNDIDMGGVYDSDSGTWSGPNYYPIGSSAVNDLKNGNFWSVFYGSFNGQGHVVKNVYCDRYHSGGSGVDGDGSQAVALFGRVGAPDASTPYPETDITIENIAVTGYIYAYRSVGGIIGKTLHVATGHTLKVKNCMNFATVKSSGGGKGTGGVVGALWNKAQAINCANFGDVTAGYKSANVAGISGYAEGPTTNSYNVGTITNNASASNVGAVAVNSLSVDVTNCYALENSAPGYTTGIVNGNQLVSGGWKSADDMKTAAFATLVSGDGRGWAIPAASDSIYQIMDDLGFAGYPVPRAFTTETATCTKVEIIAPPTNLSYVEGQKFDPTGFQVRATWSDGTSELLEDYIVSKTDALATDDKQITISGTYQGYSYSQTYNITVKTNRVNEITIYKKPTNLLYAMDENFDSTGMVVRAYYTNAPTTAVTLEDTDYTVTADKTTGVATISYTLGTDTVTATVDFTVLDSDAPKTVNGIYQIKSLNDLKWFANQVNTGLNPAACAKLRADIDASVESIEGNIHDDVIFAPIGSSSTGKRYVGTFDGAGYTVKLKIEATNGYAGLFSYLDSGAVVKNVITDGSINNTSQWGGYIGGIAGYAKGNVLIDSCINKAAIENPASYTGGVVGYMAGTDEEAKCQVVNCGNEGAVNSNSYYAGGVVGYLLSTTDVIQNCYNRGSVSGTYHVGGVAGYTRAAVVTNCYNTGAVNATKISTSNGAGGLIGSIAAALGSTAETDTVISNSYNAGTVTAQEGAANKGSICGYVNANIKLENVYYLEGTADDACVVKDGKTVTGEAAAKTDAELKALAPTLGEAYAADDANVNNGYPVLDIAVAAPVEETFDASWYDPSATDYVINTPEQLEALAAIVNGTAADIDKSDFQGKTVTLGADIALDSAKNWVAIGNADSPFAGTFDGKNHEVSGLNITDATGGYKGLFGNNTGVVKDFTISGTIGTVDAPITEGSDNIGGAVGCNDGVVSGITGKVAVCVDTTDIYAVGGIVGQNGENGTVEQCANTAKILATKCGGGVVGRNFGVVNLCTNSGAVSGGGADGSHGQGKDSIGGIVGQAGDKSSTYTATVTNCYNTGEISNPNGRWFGGIAGHADETSVIKNCYDIGVINTGYSWSWNPIIGNVDSANYPNVGNNYSLEGLNAGDTTEDTMPLTIGTVKTAAELKAADMLTLLNADGNNFAADSKKINGGYPVLSWQAPSSTGSGGGGGGSSVKPEPDNTEDDNQNNNNNNENTGIVFNDVNGHWAADAIDFVVKEKLFNGITATTFEPETTMNRAMLVTVLWRLDGQPAASANTAFTDLTSGAYYTDAVAWANANGIVKGYTDKMFAPNDEVTREQMAAILCRYAEFKGYDVSGTAELDAFADANRISAYAADAVKWAKAVGLINGRTETTLAPQGDSTRAEVAAMLQRFVQNVIK